MNIKKLMLTILFATTGMASGLTMAMTTAEFVGVCQLSEVSCSEHPLLQAYVGGALDLIAVLDEETEYLGEVYCKSPAKLFDVPAIISYIETKYAELADQNAMLALVRYFEEQGGC